MTDEEIDYNVQKELDKLQNVKSHIEKLNWQEEALSQVSMHQKRNL